MTTTITVKLEKMMPEYWGIDQLLHDMAADTVADRDAAIIELIMEDIIDFLDNAKWTVEVSEVQP